MNPPPPMGSLDLCAADLPRGAEAIVTAVEGADGTAERLAALGFAPGTAFRVVRAGEPLALAVGESRVALGRAWAQALRVVVP
ncbi:MAG: ferrous iron transport protein A [Planctomycetota bacterium]